MSYALNKSIRRLLVLVLWFLACTPGAAANAQQSAFPVPPGLDDAVQFWKQIFTRYSSTQVVLFDVLDPGKIYTVMRAPEDEQGQAMVEKERARVAADYDLGDDESRIRSQRGAKEHFLEGLKVSGRYMTQMQKIFRQEGLPVEIAYLPLVESSFNIHARSSVGAVGMWQFMPETGKKFMRVDTAVDERRDPMASTRAAARLLKENYRILGNWPLAITAYNHGTEGMFRGIKTVESDDLIDLIRGYQSPMFGFASKNFYAEFLAVVEIATNIDSYFPFLRPHRAVTLHEVAVQRQTPLQAVLKPAAISQRDFFEWNPALQPTAKVIPTGYRVKLPPHKVDAFVSAQKRAGAASPTAKTASAAKAGGGRGKSTKTTVKNRGGANAAPKSSTNPFSPKKNRAVASSS
jgi:membrane-bound lytic murein transglycosylase D